MKYWLDCFKKYASFSGRARRKEYWMFALFNSLIFCLVLLPLSILLPTIFIGDNLVSLGGIFLNVVCLAIFLPSLAVTVRRLHDIGKSGWAILLSFIPIAGPIILFIYMCKDGDKEENKYGGDPKLKTSFPPKNQKEVISSGSFDDTSCLNKILPFVKTEYSVGWAMGGLANTSFEKDKKKFAYLEYDVKKGFKWSLKIYSDEEKQDLLIEVEEQSAIAGVLLDQSGYVFKDAQKNEILGMWKPTKSLLNMFLKAPYKLIVNNEIVAIAPGENFFKLFIPSFIRKMTPRKVLTVYGEVIAKISTEFSQCISVKPECGAIQDDRLAIAIAAFVAICGVQD